MQDADLKITCPKCAKNNIFDVTESVKCVHCDASFDSVKFAKKALIGTVSALVIGGIAGKEIDDFLEPNRYPIKTEYALIEGCVKGTNATLLMQTARKKFEICSCALSITQKHFDHNRYEKYPIAFGASLKGSTQRCVSDPALAQGTAH